MVNQSLVSVPPNVEEPVVLRRFLSRLVEQLDVVLGNRAGPSNQYIDQEQLLAASSELTELLDEARSTLETALNQVEDVSEEALLELAQRITAAEEKNVEQDARLDAVELKNTQQDTRLDAVELKNTQQDTRLDNLESAGYITDAPSDGNTYGRKDGAWVIIP